ncbi:Pentatricopeptide repeat [Phaffia rhodozyma]|uniref:Pentatricopeptide repeat n=1 Tax=Phaffia rhodozyma TaxID=264483 RepID=A0A0F7SVY2_PHARH|nr:Pentatricopeptide repeat [Phaffia rhodozyma]
MRLSSFQKRLPSQAVLPKIRLVRSYVIASDEAPSMKPTSEFPSFLIPYLSSTSVSDASWASGMLSSTERPPIHRLPSPPPLSQVQLLSSLNGILPQCTWQQHLLVTRYYFALDPSMITTALHRQVASTLARGRGTLDGYRRLKAVVQRMMNLGVEVPLFVRDQLIRISTPDKADEHDRYAELKLHGNTVEKMNNWNKIYGSESATQVGDVYYRPSSRSFNMLLESKHPSSVFSNMISQSPNPNRHMTPIIKHHARSFTLISNLPALLQNPSTGKLTIKAMNEVLAAFSSDENIRLTVPMEAYVALRRHAAGLPWRRVYIDRASKGLYQNYDDPAESFANPILDSLGYDFPKDLEPNRDTYTILLRSCIYRGELNLALTIFKDMLNPNGLSLRLPGAPPGQKGQPPNELESFPPNVSDYTAFFSGFYRFGELPTLDSAAARYYDAHNKILRRGEDGGSPEGRESEADMRRKTTEMWNIGMGFQEAPLEDPYTPGFNGEIPSRNQYAVNRATEPKKWVLPTLIILFRSFLSMSPSNYSSTVPNPRASYLPPARSRANNRAMDSPTPRRILFILRAFGQVSNFNPYIIKGVWEACEEKFGMGNDEGWVNWKVTPELKSFLNVFGLKAKPAEWGKPGGYEGWDDE